MSPRILGLTLSFVLLLSTSAFAQGKKASEMPDLIVTKDGKKIPCTVEKEDPKNLIFKDQRDKQQTISWENVEKIDYKDFPGELAQAEAAIEQRNYAKANSLAEEAIKASTDGRGKDLFLARARVAKAKALRALNQYREAATAAEQALDAANGNRYAGDAYIVRVDALASAGDDACVKVGEEAEGKADQYGEEFKFDIYLLVGDYFCNKKKDATEAKKKYAFVQNSNRPDMLDRAKLGLAEVKLIENNVKGAMDAFGEIMRTARDSFALAGACAGLGNATISKFEKESKNDAKANLLREALTFFLRGAVLGQPSGSAPSEKHELCLHKAAETAEKIVSTLPDDKKDKTIAGKKFFVDYARKIYEDLARQYGNSDKAETYRNAIQKLKEQSLKLAPPAAPAEKKD